MSLESGQPATLDVETAEAPGCPPGDGPAPARRRVLACAFACSPAGNNVLGHGEAVLGWNVVVQIARFHDIDVLTHPSNREGIEKALAGRGILGLRFHYFDLPPWVGVLRRWQGCFQLYSYLWQIRAYSTARRLHQQRPFDLFHHVTYANDWAASFVGALLPVPFLRGPGGGAQRTPRQFLSEYTWPSRFWERVRSLMGWALRHDPFFLRGQARASKILVCNRESEEALPRRFRTKAVPFPVNGIAQEDLNLIGRVRASTVPASAAGTNGTGFCALSAARLIALKGYGLAIRAFKPFADRHPEAKLIIAGDGPDLPRLRRIAQSLQLEAQVLFPGWLERDALLAAMCSADVFLFPSLRDGGGAVVVEAMAAGKPVVCLDLAGPALHITDTCGIKVPARSRAETLALMDQALERLYRDRALCSRLGQAARARAEQSYAWDRLGERLQSLYEEVLTVPAPSLRTGPE